MGIIGIDFGTTTSEVAYYKNGKAQVIKNVQEGDSYVVPSVVYIEGNNIKVGTKAKNQMVLKPNNTISEVKKYIGTDKKIYIDNREFTPEEIAAKILIKMKEIAELYTGEEIDEAVITVPANFNDKQRKSITEAAKLAHLKVDRIINEPTAAALAYGINQLDNNMKFLVYDLGGGTFDVTVLELFDGVLDVKVSRGSNIGGKDIDSLIINYIAESFYNENKVKLDLTNPRVLSALKSNGEECKKNLSFEEVTDIIITYISKDENNNPLDINLSLTREKLSELCMDIIKSTEQIVDDAILSSGFKVSDIDKVILVGGSTRMISIRDMLKSKFGEEKLVLGINPDEIVSLGAAIQGAIKNKEILPNKGLVLADACSYTLGVEVLGNKLDPIIKRDTKLPAKVTKYYTTVEDNQDEVEIKVYQGESITATDNLFLDCIDIKNIPNGKRGEQFIDITFQYDLNGILNIEVDVKGTGKIIEKTIKRNNTSLNREYDVRCATECTDNAVIKDEVPKFIKQENSDTIIEKVDEKPEPEKIEELPKSEEIEKEEINNLDDRENSAEINEKNVEGEEAEEDYSNIFNEVVNLVQYVNSLLGDYDEELQKTVRDKQGELLTAVKSNEFKNIRAIEYEILDLMGLNEE